MRRLAIRRRAICFRPASWRTTPPLADALSTAVFVLGSEKGMALVREMEGVDAILIRKDNTILASDGFAEKYALQLTKGKPYTL